MKKVHAFRRQLQGVADTVPRPAHRLHVMWSQSLAHAHQLSLDSGNFHVGASLVQTVLSLSDSSCCPLLSKPQADANEGKSLEASAAEANVEASGPAQIVKELLSVKNSMDVAYDVLRDDSIRYYAHMHQG